MNKEKGFPAVMASGGYSVNRPTLLSRIFREHFKVGAKQYTEWWFPNPVKSFGENENDAICDSDLKG